ncbi:hypothetical protein BGAL_0440g00070 [Botrytis galanthina]|uniref:2EXR domain-containing protein n=1 Tax=Botrytis galanthina TaxID=278940 RepID=A0A4S8QYK0_9HELO|nr:hypothetical protein BGAL_0440g00070 [Botrytis galanthina]
MDPNNQLSIFGPSSSLAIEAYNKLRAAQQAEREECESPEELAHKRKPVILRVPAAEPDPLAKPSLIVKFNIQFKPSYEWKKVPIEMQFSILKFTFPGQRMFDLDLQPCVLIDPSFAVRSAIDDQTTEQRNLNATAHAVANSQRMVRAKPPIALSINRASRQYALETYKLLVQPRANRWAHIALPNEYFSALDYDVGRRPVLLNYTSLKEIIVLVPHLYCCIHGNETRGFFRMLGTQHPKEHYVDKFKNLVEGKWATAMAKSWGSFPLVRYAGTCTCDQPSFW